MNMDHCRRLLDGVPDQRMTGQPVAGMNHVAWIVGHLVHSFEMIGGELQIKPWLPQGWATLFGTGNWPSPMGESYPSKTELVAALDDGQRRIVDALNAMTDKDLDGPLPDERHRHVFPTLGSAVLHILTVHAATHVGQLSAWRRAMGLSPAADPM